MAYKYFAFISYSSKDLAWGKRLQKELEHYRMPATLCSEHHWQSKTPIRPVFFAPTDIQPGGLSEELKQRLNASEHLIVICSPHSAQSDWVGREIAYFHSLGRPRNIHFFIVDGIPHSDNPETECFNPILKTLELPEILGANINEKVYDLPWLNKQRAYIQLITKLLGIDFDALWQRHRRLLIRQTIMWVIGVICVIAAIIAAFFISKPVEVQMTIHEVTPVNTSLPPIKNAHVTLVINNEKKAVTVSDVSPSVTFQNIPADMIGKEVKVHFSCQDYLTLDTTFVLSRDVKLNISRDINAYGHIHFRLLDSNVKPVSNKTLSIDGIVVKSNNLGIVDAVIPIDKQKKTYHLSSSDVTLQSDLLDAQCTESTVVFTK